MSKSTLFVQLFAGLVLIATGVHASCPIELSPASVVVKYGDPVLVNCSTSDNQSIGIGWEASQGGTGVEQVNHLAWTVESLTQWTDSPFCFFTFPSFEQCKKELNLIIYTFPETITISGDPSSEMEAGKEYSFTCHIPNVAPVQKLTVRWYKGDTIIHADTFDDPTKRPVDQTSDLKFTLTRQDNGGSLRCEAYMDLSPDGPQLNVSTQEYNITVVYGPDILCSVTDILEQQTLEEICLVTGNPTPRVRWLKDGEPVNSTVPLTRDNAGMYTLEAQGFKSVQKPIPVLVLYGPELTCPLTYTAVEDSPHDLTCNVTGFPKPETLWFKDGEEVVLPQKLTRSDAGQYFVIASNALSSVNVTVDITVLYPPSPIVELEDSEVHVGSSVWLKCSSTGNPRPKYSWKYYQAANVVEENEDGVSRLLIHNATAHNMGSYTCEAWNDRGNVSKTVRVNVKGAKQECPIRITPDTMVMPYKSKTQNATCTPTSDSTANVNKIFWQDLQGKRTDNAVWFADTHKDWNESPVCYANFRGIGKCHKTLSFILYKTPDSVTINHLDNSSSVVENRELQLQCDVINVAPAQNLRIHWYRGSEALKTGSQPTTRCWTDNDTNCDISMIRSPVNVSSTISITLNRNHSGADFRCEAQLDLGPGGPEPSPNMMSSPLNITVFYKPTINTTRLPKTIPVFRGYPEELVCEADGLPPPRIQWLYSSDMAPHVLEGKLIVSEAGLYNCTATNDVDSTVHVVVVVLKGKPVNAAQCQVKMSPPRGIVKFGDSFTANCTSLYSEIAGIGWESTYGGVGLQTGVSTVPFKIDSAKHWDIKPGCYVTLPNGDQCEEPLPITVYQLPESVSIAPPLSEASPMVEGKAYRMQCDVVNVAPAGLLSVIWHQGGQIIHNDTFKESTLSPVSKSSVFTLTAKRDDDGSQIWCEAKLNLGPGELDRPAVRSDSQKVAVLYPPAFVKPETETVELSDRKNITLYCNATGNPAPIYSWHFPEAVQEASKNEDVNKPFLIPSLQFPGNYSCRASNAQGTRVKYFTVIEAPRDHTTLAAIIGVFAALGVLIFIAGVVFVTRDGTFSCNQSKYLRGQPSGTV